MIVTVLATIVLGLVSVLLTNTLPSAHLRGTAGEIAAAMRQMKHLARMSGEDARFVVDLDRKRYGVEGRRTRSIPTELTVVAEDPLSGEIRSGKYYMVFHAGGSTEGGAVILSYGRKSLRIEPDPVVGGEVK